MRKRDHLNGDPTDAPAASAADIAHEIRRVYEDVARHEGRGRLVPHLFVWAFTALSFFGTYVGLRNIIRSGDVPSGAGLLFGDLAVAGLVLLATLAMVHFLQRFLATPWTFRGFWFFVVYLGLLLFSVTFGFAFYWERLEARRQSVGSALAGLEEFVTDIDTAGVGMSVTIDNVKGLDQDFRDLAVRERDEGNTCGDNSPPGPGPRMRHRTRRAGEIAAEVFILEQAFTQIEAPLARMDAVLPIVQRLGDDDLDAESLEIEAAGDAPIDAATGEAPAGAPDLVAMLTAASADNSAQGRRQVLREARRDALRARAAINRLAADPSIDAASAKFRQWGQEYQVPGLVRRDDPTPYVCYSPEAANLLLAAAATLDNLPTVTVPELPDYAGPEATREAVDRMLGSTGAVFGLGRLPSLARLGGDGPDDGADAAFRAGVSVGRAGGGGSGPGSIGSSGGGAPRLTADDTFPLFVAVIIDALLFFSAVASREGPSGFSQFRARVRDAMNEKVNPLHVAELRSALEELPGWRALDRFRFNIGDDVLFAAPLEKGVKDAALVHDTLRVWIATGVARRVNLKASVVREHLARNGAAALLDAVDAASGGEAREFFVVQMLPDKFNLAFLQAIFRGLPPGLRGIRSAEEAAADRWTADRAGGAVWRWLGGLFQRDRRGPPAGGGPPPAHSEELLVRRPEFADDGNDRDDRLPAAYDLVLEEKRNGDGPHPSERT